MEKEQNVYIIHGVLGGAYEYVRMRKVKKKMALSRQFSLIKAEKKQFQILEKGYITI